MAYMPDQLRSKGSSPTRDPGNEVAYQMRSFSFLSATTVCAIFHSLFAIHFKL